MRKPSRRHSRPAFQTGLWALLSLLWLAQGTLLAGPITPIYTATFTDAITGPNQFIGNDGKRYWTITPGADSYQNDFYERPTTQTFQVIGVGPAEERFAAAEYFAYLDIVQAKAGFDSQFFYVAIEMLGRDNRTSDGVNTVKGLIERYGFRISNHPDGRGGFLLVADQPEQKNSPNTDYANLGTFGYQDTNGDVGGRGLLNGTPPSGLNVTKGDNAAEEAGMNGYNLAIISDGRNGAGVPVLWVRIDPTNNNIVEFAFDYRQFGFTEPDFGRLAYLEFETNKGGPKDPQNYLWNDKYTPGEAGSPYRATTGDLSKSEFGTQGTGNIYELDTLRGGAVIPEPATVVLTGLGLAALVRRSWRSRRRS